MSFNWCLVSKAYFQCRKLLGHLHRRKILSKGVNSVVLLTNNTITPLEKRVWKRVKKEMAAILKLCDVFDSYNYRENLNAIKESFHPKCTWCKKRSAVFETTTILPLLCHKWATICQMIQAQSQTLSWNLSRVQLCWDTLFIRSFMYPPSIIPCKANWGYFANFF